MAIQPIDLQALFTQVDKAAKAQTALRDGHQIQESIQQAQVQRKLEQNVQSVNQAQNMGEEAETIREDKRRGSQAYRGEAKEKQGEEDEAEAEEERRDLIRDPALGRNIDISG